MIEPGVVVNVVALAIAAIVGAVIGGRRGVSDVERKTVESLRSLVDAQELRIAHLERDKARMEAQIAEMAAEILQLREELKTERKISARLKA